jgi:hypothetical protein
MEIFNLSDEELREKENQKQVFKEMLRRLENEGKCRYVFHHLAKVLFNDPLE